uniref:polyhomeotic-like protein 1 isoform X1 n=2 Tax=Oncorhynchus gorbuscha TaxID=8017 RepID=UPI001EAEA6C9|nr:polyhomeotic-like protein 1 isoform X1 [Oncorhynchus gorbuscha]
MMETDGDQNQGSTNGTTPSGVNSRPSPMNSMSLYERQAVQALQALQRQPNAAQYFQQLMLQQQINSAQLQNLAAVQQATFAASRQSSPATNSTSQTTSTTVTSVNVTTSGGGAINSTRAIGPGSSGTSTISQSVLLGGSAAGQGQMYLRVNRSLRAPLSSQLIFMPGSTTTAAMATVTQQPQTQQQQQQEVTPTSSSNQSDNDQVQNLALRCVGSPKGVGVKTETPERGEIATYSLIQSSHQQFNQSTQQSPTKPTQLQQSHIKIPTYIQSSNANLSSLNLKTGNHHSNTPSSPSTSVPLSQLLLSGPNFGRGGAITTVNSAAAATHILVPTSSAPTQSHSYQMGAATIKPNVSTQTLVVQPLQKSTINDKGGHGNGPIPIQPKTQQGLRMPLQLPSRNPPPILPAPPANNQTSAAQPPPHIPVQIVGARPSSIGNPQALALVQARNACSQDGATLLNSSNSASLLTMVASIASRERGGLGKGVGLKSLQSAQEALSLAHVSHVQAQANQSPRLNPNQNCTLATSISSQSQAAISPPTLSRSSLTLPLPLVEASSASTVVAANGESVCPQPPQGKSMKRKSESDAANEEDGPPPPHLVPLSEHSPALSSSAMEAGTGPPSPSPVPSPSPALSVSRVGGGQGERAPPPQAVVKPHVLTHLIEGFVIQEGAEPFPVSGPVKEPAGEDLAMDNPDASQPETVNTATVLKCEYCKSFAPARQFRGTKRFCSLTCSKRYNVSCSQHFRLRQGLHLTHSDEDGVLRRRVPHRTSSEIASAKIAGRPLPVKCRSESSRSDDISSCEEEEDDPMSFSPASSSSCHQPPPTLRLEGSPAPHFLPGSPAQWSVEEVSQFISSLQDCEELAAHFLSQEIDGQALLLLREEHLMSTMNIKLGPALKICAHINNLKD